MSVATRLRDPIVVIKPTEADEDIYGDKTEGEPVEETYQGLIWQGESREVERDRDTIVTSWRLVIEARSGLQAAHRVRWQGKTFEVVGAPVEVRRGNLGGFSHIQADLLHKEDV